jgi:hypothetical protein
MSYSVLNLETDLTGVTHGTTLNSIVNLQGIINRAARQLLLDVDPQETKRYGQLPQVFETVYQYAAPADLKGNAIFDIRPQTPRRPYDIYLQNYSQAFDINKNNSVLNSFNIDFSSGVKTLLVDANFLTAPTVINDAASLSGNGTWGVGGGATALVVDNINYIADGGSLQLNLSAGQSSGYVENSTINPVNISAQLNQGTLFLWTYLPVATNFSSVTLWWGSSAGNYYSQTATVAQNNVAFQNGWNLLSFAWNGATVTGTPDPTKINYLRVTWNYNSTLQTAVRLNFVTSAPGTILVVGYYSKYLFRNISGIWIEQTSDPSDLINLDTDSYNLLFNLVCYMVAQQTQGLDALFYDADYFLGAYNAGVARYKALYKSEKQLPQSTYYGMKTPGYTKYINRQNPF